MQIPLTIPKVYGRMDIVYKARQERRQRIAKASRPNWKVNGIALIWLIFHRNFGNGIGFAEQNIWTSFVR